MNAENLQWVDNKPHEKMTSSLHHQNNETFTERKNTNFPRFIFSFIPILTVFTCVMIFPSFAEANINRTDSLQKETVKLSRYRRGFFPKDDSIDTSVDLLGYVCIGHGIICCMDFYFAHSGNIEIHAKIESKTRFVKMQGSYVHNNNTGTWECDLTDLALWYIVLKGNESTTWSESVTNNMLTMGAEGRSRTEIWHTRVTCSTFLDPSHLHIKGDEIGDIVRAWNFKVTKPIAQVTFKIVITIVDQIIPEIIVSPQSARITEGKDELNLMCGTRIHLPQNSLLTWKRNGEFLGSLSHGTTNMIHRGIHGSVDWIDNKFVYYKNNPDLYDTGVYECCISLQNHPNKCNQSNVIVVSPRKTLCTNKKFMPASPFQINHFQSRKLFREGNFVTILWKFNISEWKISTKYPLCQKHLVNMEMGIERWFGTNAGIINRSKRGIVEGILGGVGTIGSITNSMDINSLKSDLETAGLIGSNGIKVQRNLNQVLENMIMKTATVLGPSITHLQDATLELMISDRDSQVARTCLEIQTEYSTNFKIIAQAFQSGITPLGILQSLPHEYRFAINHTDLWVNKWIGCNLVSECYSTSMIPVAGKEQILVPITILGLPVSDTQLLFYHLQYSDFVLDGKSTELEQLDLSSCLHFQNKVICLSNQDKNIFHSCYHNHTLCSARIEQVMTPFDLITLVGKSKVCFQIMSDEGKVTVLFSSCIHTENMNRGLYCIEGDLLAINVNGVNVNISNALMRNVSALPIQYKISQVDTFPWKNWTQMIQKDKGLLMALSRELKTAEIIFQHDQGQLLGIEHDWSDYSGYTWWSRFKNTINMLKKTSVKSAIGSTLLHPLIILFIIIVLCIFIQICLICRVKKMYHVIKVEISKGEDVLKEFVRRKMNSDSILISKGSITGNDGS